MNIVHPEDVTTVPVCSALSIAGSDPSGGAGIQADLKTFSALDVYGMAAITALTAQNTTGVQDGFMIPSEFLAAQLESVFTDLRVDAVKIGMLGTADTVHAVADILEKYCPRHVILDPVMVAKSGDALLETNALTALKERLIPLVDLVTPNLPEVAVLLDCAEPANQQQMTECATRLQDKLNARNVLVKGGHLTGAHGHDIPDVLALSRIHVFTSKRIATTNTHGTGCTLSSAITAFLAHGLSIPVAVEKAQQYVHQAIQSGSILKPLYQGMNGPVHHFHALWKNTKNEGNYEEA